jgi:hypothetical protein
MTNTNERLMKYEESLVAGWQKIDWPIRYAESGANAEMRVPKNGYRIKNGRQEVENFEELTTDV